MEQRLNNSEEICPKTAGGEQQSRKLPPMAVSLDNLEKGCVKDMLCNLNEMTSQIRNAWRLGADSQIKSPQLVGGVEKMVIAGMGGSGIGGCLVQKFAQTECAVPVIAVNGYDLPKHLNERTLVVLVSHSGNTEEIIACHQAAKQQGATCVAITSGGRLAELAQSDGDTLITIPAHLMPREAIAYLTIPIFLIADGFGIWQMSSRRLLDILEAVNDVIFCCNEFVLEKENQAKQLARKICGKAPVILGVEGMMESVARCWKNLLNENAKLPALVNTVPEFCHNEIEVISEKNIIIILRTMTEDVRLKKQIAALEQLTAEHHIQTETVWLMGKSLLAKAYGMIAFGDYVSLYLAQLGQKDCSRIPAVDSLKKLV